MNNKYVEFLIGKYRNEQKVMVVANGVAEKAGELELSLCIT